MGEGVESGEKRQLLVSSPKALEQYSPVLQRIKKQNKKTGRLSDRLPALQRDLFLNFHPQEFSLIPVSRAGNNRNLCQVLRAPPPPPEPHPA